MDKIRIGIVGLGKIARDQHLETIRHSADFELTGTADPRPGLAHVPHYPDIEALLAAADSPAAVAICTPPQVRYAVARKALADGRHVLLEKPPGTTVGEVEALEQLADDTRVTLFCAWHSQFAPAILPASAWIESRRVVSLRIEWKEDVRVWHPGQQWIWAAGGFGVFDPGINALSAALMILPERFHLVDAVLRFPQNCETPIAAELQFSSSSCTDMWASLDFLQEGPQTWEIEVETDDGTLLLSAGGERLAIDGTPVDVGETGEYPALYRRFAELIRSRSRAVDLQPLRLVADAMLRGRRETVPPFSDPAV